MPAPAFMRGVESNIRFWREKVARVEDKNFSHLEPDRSNIYVAVQIGFTFPESQLEALDLALNLYDFIELGGYWQDWIPVLKRGLSLPGQSVPVQIRVLNQLGFYHFLLFEAEPALEYYRAAEKIARENHDIYGLANTEYGLCNVYYLKQQYDTAEKHGLNALDLFVQANAPPDKVVVANNILGMVYHATGNYLLAERYKSHAVEICCALNNPPLLARMKSNLADTLRAQHEDAQAMRLYEGALDLLEEGASPLLKFQIINNLGIIYFDQENYQKAELAFLALDAHYLRRNGHLFRLGTRANNLGNVYLKTNRLDEAEQLLLKAAEIWRRIHDDIHLGNTLGDLGETLEKQNRPREALPCYEEAIQLLGKYPQDAWACSLYERIMVKTARLKDSTPV